MQLGAPPSLSDVAMKMNLNLNLNRTNFLLKWWYILPLLKFVCFKMLSHGKFWSLNIVKKKNTRLHSASYQILGQQKMKLKKGKHYSKSSSNGKRGRRRLTSMRLFATKFQNIVAISWTMPLRTVKTMISSNFQCIHFSGTPDSIRYF